jgi:hypothetical protein
MSADTSSNEQTSHHVKVPSRTSAAKKPNKFSRFTTDGCPAPNPIPVTPSLARHQPPEVVFMRDTNGRSPASNVFAGDTAVTSSTPETADTLSSPWQAAVNESITTIRTQQKQAKKAIVYMSNEILNNSTHIHSLQHAVTEIKSESTQIKLDSSKLIRMMERAYGKCSDNDDFNAEMDLNNDMK